MGAAIMIKKEIRGVVFDVDGTLYWQLPVRMIMMGLLVFTYCRQPQRLRNIIAILRAYRSSQEKIRLEIFKGTENPYHRQMLLTATLTDVPVDVVEKVIEQWFQKRPLPLLRWFRKRGLISMLETLKRRGVRIGAFSDYPAEEKLCAMAIRNYFSAVLASNDVGVRGFKPNTNGFHIIAERMGLETSQMVYIGDREAVDRPGAEKAGMTCYIVKPHYTFTLKR